MFFLSSFACILFEKKRQNPPQISLSKTHIHQSPHSISSLSAKEEERDNTHTHIVIKMASKNKKFNVKHMGGNVDRNESERVTKDYEVRSFAFPRFVSLRFGTDQ